MPVLLPVAGTCLGVVAVAVEYGWRQPLLWAPDLVVGAAFALLAGLAWHRARAVSLLAAGICLAWFAGTLLPFAAYWHRGLLLHLLLRGLRHRLPGGWHRALVGVGYLTAIVQPIWHNDLAAAVLAVSLAALLVMTRARPAELASGLAFALVVAGGAVARTMVPPREAALPVLLAYEAVLLLVCVLWIVRVRGPGRDRVTDLVVDLGATGSESLRDELARAIGDPTLRIGFWDATGGGYLNASGEPLDAANPAAGQRVTRIDGEHGPQLALLHRPDAFDDPQLLAGVTSAVRLTARNAQLQHQALRRLEAVEESRRRILIAEDSERLRLSEQVEDAVVTELSDIATAIRTAAESSSAPTLARLETAATRVEEVRVAIDAAVAGLAPSDLADGLMPALRAIAERCPLPVELAGNSPRLAAEVESAVAFACSEAVTNAVKHAGAQRLTIQVDGQEGNLEVAIADDGRGGAEASRGSGITGITDRLAVLGGAAAISSPSGGGTTVTLTVPIASSPA